MRPPLSPDKPQRQKVYNARATPARQGKRGLTVYVYPEAHAELKSLAEELDRTLEELLKEGLNLVLQRYGRSPLAGGSHD